jgi:hypothetical protein
LTPLLFLDFDDVVCLNQPYGGFDALSAAPPPGLYENLFAQGPRAVLRNIHDEHQPRYVITTSWLRFFEKKGLAQVLTRGGLSFVAENLHEHWEAPPLRETARASVIQFWLRNHHHGEPFLILDDVQSGTGLKLHYLRHHAILCEVDEGLLPAHVVKARRIYQLEPTTFHGF